MKQFLTKIKAFFIHNVLILSLSAILLIVFIFGGVYSRYMTSQIDVHAQERYEQVLIDMVDEGKSLTLHTSKGSNEKYPTPSSGEDYQPVLLESYKVFNKAKEHIAFIYIIESIGNAEGVQAAYAISIKTNRLMGVEVLSHSETIGVKGQYYNKLTDAFFNKFTNKDLDVIDFSIETVAGATYSSLAFETGMKYARELYASDTDFEIINVVLTIDSVKVNTDFTTINEYKYIAEVTFDLDDKKATIYLDNDFKYLGKVSGADVSQEVKDALPIFVPAANLTDASIKIGDFDSLTNELTISVQGYSRKGVTMTLTINLAKDGIDTITFVSSTESYEYSNGYNGAGLVVENAYIDEYNTNGLFMDSVAGATVTSNAMTNALKWVQAFELLLSGGN